MNTVSIAVAGFSTVNAALLLIVYLWLIAMKANTPPPAEQRIPLLAQHRTELAASRAWLEHNGIAQRRVPRWFERLK